MLLATHWIEGERAYTGAELRPHYLLSELGVRGSALVAFLGPCDVATERLVDWEDRLGGESIRARRMVHFLGELFGWPLREAVFFQRLLIAAMGESLRARGLDVERRGDDLFRGAGKLSVSIVSASPVSCLLHAGINVDPSGAPVEAAGLGELGVEPGPWAREILARIQGELEDMAWACAKVRPV